MKERMQSVGFRLPATFVRELRRRAEDRGLSPGMYARQVILDALSGSGNQEIQRGVSSLHEAIDRILENLVIAAVALLSQKEILTAEEADAWAKRTLL